MSQYRKNFTTLLSDLTPETDQFLRSTPDWDASLPQNSYAALELDGVNVSFHRTVTTANDIVPLHTHSYYEYIFCRQVPEMEYLVGAYRYRIQTGDVIYIPPGVPHRPIFPHNCTIPFIRDEMWMCTEFVINFGTRLPSNFFSKQETPYLFRISSHRQAEISQFFQKGTEETENQLFRWDNSVEGYATLLTVTMCRALLDESTQLLQRENDSLFDRIVTYLEENLDQKITLEDTAARFFVSKSTVNRVFQKHMGTSFYRCLTQRRLLAAQQMILEGAALETVSIKTGFSDYATFYRAFRQEYGISPRQFRKNLQTYPEPSVKAGDLRF